jgi:Telomerase activating protein Est1/Est1 DNA/RNA binding domain
MQSRCSRAFRIINGGPSLRRHIIQVIFKYPSSVHTVKLETTLWIDTSHAVIARYRDLISKLDNKGNKNPSADQRRANGRFGRGEEGPVALRKLMTRFRSFLSAEERFWSGLILRLVKTFELTTATKAIDALSLSVTDPADLASPQKVTGSRTSLVPSDSPMAEEISEDIKDKKLLFLQKSLISLGDLARYREQYNEGGGQPRPGNEAQADRGRGTSANLAVPRPRNHGKALECYRQAKLLLPDEGNPSNQLAILSLYGGDSFAAVMHYYRALCVKHAFPTSRENLHKTLQKVFDAYRKSSEVLSDPVEALQRDVLILHALWQLKPS